MPPPRSQPMAVCPQCQGAKEVPRFPADATPTYAVGRNKKFCEQCQGTGQVPDGTSAGPTHLFGQAQGNVPADHYFAGNGDDRLDGEPGPD